MNWTSAFHKVRGRAYQVDYNFFWTSTNFLYSDKHLRGFQESEILFQPTYKYVPGTLNFDPTNQRVPSYTDRILWKERSKKPSITCQHYNSVSELQSSDHLPVWASFEVHLKPGRDT